MDDQPSTQIQMDLGELDKLLGFHLRMASAVVARDFAVATVELELSQKQYATLELIAGNPCSSQVDIGRVLGTDRATMMALIDRLEARKLITRRRSSSDARRHELSLSVAGERLLLRARTLIKKHEHRFWTMLGASDGEALMVLLRQLSRTAGGEVRKRVA